MDYTIRLKMFMNPTPHTAWEVSILLSIKISHYFITIFSLTLFQDTTVPKIFGTFRALGLRHLVIVDKENYVKGIITRKDFL